MSSYTLLLTTTMVATCDYLKAMWILLYLTRFKLNFITEISLGRYGSISEMYVNENIEEDCCTLNNYIGERNFNSSDCKQNFR